MAFVTPSQPNLTDFLTFLSTSVGIPTSALPVDSEWPQYALDQSLALVLSPPCVMGISYTLAVYNGATHLLFVITPDVAGQSFFAGQRKAFNLIQPPTGLVVSSSDQGTSTQTVAPGWAEGLTIEQLGFLRTPWGRQYLQWQMSYGPNIVGLT